MIVSQDDLLLPWEVEHLATENFIGKVAGR